MIPRLLTPLLTELATKSPILTLIGCRQSGKTTLLRSIFPDHEYVNLEDPELRAFALEDPKGFLLQFKGKVILDEAQRTPNLFSYIQTISDASPKSGQFILSGSQNFLLMEQISQSLAGRTIVNQLLPLSLQELREDGRMPLDIDQAIFLGGYPRIHGLGIDPRQWLPSYIQTYVERDVRTLAHITDLDLFQRLLGLCAGRIGQLLNYSSLAGEVGVSDKTVRSWITILKASHLLFELQPFHRNLGKRLTKSTKLYFCDTALACSLLRIHSTAELCNHPLRGNLFENLVILELMKQYQQKGQIPEMYFWRDQSGHEVDLLLGSELGFCAVEIKSSQTIHASMFDGLAYLAGIYGDSVKKRVVVYGGSQSQQRVNGSIIPWNQLNLASFLD
jgi:uncharacterized protein